MSRGLDCATCQFNMQGDGERVCAAKHYGKPIGELIRHSEGCDEYKIDFKYFARTGRKQRF